MKKQPLDALTGMRFFAAGYVILYHLFFVDWGIRDVLVASWPWPVLNFIDRGCVAVSFFFVLSGFILAYNYGSPRGELAASKHDFWLARFARIVPMYMVALLLATPFYFKDILYNLSPGQMLPVGSILGNYAANILFVNAWIPPFNQINPPGWTLSAEAFFYLVFPFVLGRFGRLSNHKLLCAAGFFYLLSLLPALLYCVWVPCGTNIYSKTTTDVEYYIALFLYNLPLLRLPEFLIGMILGLLYQRMPAQTGGTWRSSSGLAVSAFILALAFTVVVPWPVLRTGFFVPFEAWVVWALARRPSAAVAKALSWTPMVLLGEASYGMYLFHFTVLFLLTKRAVAAGFPFTVPVVIGLFLTVLAVVTLISIILFWVVEEPARRWIRKRFQRGKVPVHPAASVLG